MHLKYVSETEEEVYCYCRTPEEPGNPMIGCDASDCPIEWFHFSHVGITEEPQTDEEWFCDGCKERLNNFYVASYCFNHEPQ